MLIQILFKDYSRLAEVQLAGLSRCLPAPITMPTAQETIKTALHRKVGTPLRKKQNGILLAHKPRISFSSVWEQQAAYGTKHFAEERILTHRLIFIHIVSITSGVG